jgi:3-dehydroquinate dehydratase-1
VSETHIGDVSLDAATPRVIVPITGRDLRAIEAQATLIATSDADLVEWLADYFSRLRDDPAVVEAATMIKRIVARPLIYTVRSREQGGQFWGGDDAYTTAIRSGADCARIDAVDIEFERNQRGQLIRYARGLGCQVINSHHVTRSTPSEDDMVRLLHEMGEWDGVAKLAVYAKSAEDAVALLHATARAAAEPGTPVITMAMGAHGVITRLIGHRFGSCATFATVAGASAPGQPSLASLRHFWTVLDEVDRGSSDTSG